MSAEWRKSLRNYSTSDNDVDIEKALKNLLIEEEKRVDGTFSKNFKDLNDTRKQFREAIRKISEFGKTDPKDLLHSSSDSLNDIPIQDFVKPVPLFERDSGDAKTISKEKIKKQKSKKWNKNWLESRLGLEDKDHERILEKLEKLGELGPEDGLNMLKEMAKEKTTGLNNSKREERIRNRNKGADYTSNKDVRKKSYIQTSDSEPEEIVRKTKKKVLRKRYSDNLLNKKHLT